MPSHYKHTQIGYFLMIVLGSALIILISLALRTNFHAVSIIAIGVLACCLLLFSSLTITVTSTVLEFHFGVRFLQKRLSIENISGYQTIKNPWYYGWGIHAIPGGWVYNVSGFDAVEITMRNGRKYRIGTDDAPHLMEALNRVIRTTPPYG